MLITPAIDLRNGKVVRLFRGSYAKETVYADDPLAVAEQWNQQGAEILHIIDLDGALAGKPKNQKVISAIIKKLGVKVHVGGGVRSAATIKSLLDKGVYRVIMSTRIFDDDDFLHTIDEDVRARIIVSIDSKAGIVMNKGWTEQTALTVQDALKKIEQSGIGLAVVTDVTSDGTLSGPNMGLLTGVLTGTRINILCAGGISGIEDIKNLRRLKNDYPNLFGVIIGKALYEGKIDLREAIHCAE
ncbi:MAG: 1-(5-phosphoribosyl)-5-[(5-phosphoribosylamino)methylideneamino]imidazole-4-carboxamide isomerase [Candidatus Omnitrophica bacterium]|jgi:Phosphoribosylformimino-5-aminoimidazole carboxamide ribonucleotide (ProFAR) isomerase|nr:1-(5-phosphoribosyl)-5-[(5-phosphoribosylamino)methylideneamino]imidazole-4-carboxamide isomerase [Candidatus Omnitrophota bacterium]